MKGNTFVWSLSFGGKSFEVPKNHCQRKKRSGLKKNQGAGCPVLQLNLKVKRESSPRHVYKQVCGEISEIWHSTEVKAKCRGSNFPSSNSRMTFESVTQESQRHIK
jgi:hypothetical protein